MSEKSQRHSLQYVPEYGEDGIKIINTELKLLQLRKMKSIIGPVVRNVPSEEKLQKVEREYPIGKENEANTSSDLDNRWTEKRLKVLEENKAYLAKARELNKCMNESNMRQKQSSSKSAGSDPSILSYQRRLQVSS